MSGGMKSNCPDPHSVRADVYIDWSWADGHMEAIAKALAQCAMHIIQVETASATDDLKRATDLKIVANTGDVAVRIRRPGYLQRFGDFTLRSWRRSGNETELQKIIKGYGDWYLYAWSDGEGGFEDWILVDLNALRESGLLDGRSTIENWDARTGFIQIDRNELIQVDCLKASRNGHQQQFFTSP